MVDHTNIPPKVFAKTNYSTAAISFSQTNFI